MLPQWMQRLQMEESFSWLSTLGGAYSSLGENMYNCVSYIYGCTDKMFD